MKYSSSNREYKSKYTYDNSNVLKNKLDIHDDLILHNVERTFTAAKIAELNIKPIRGNFDFKHLCKIHEYIFQDLYTWAGKTRDVEISKGGTNFAPCTYLKSAIDELFSSLKQEKFLTGLPVDKLSERLAHYYTELNFAHPFREGNGRTQREFIRELADKNGYVLDWNKMDQDKLMEATIESTRNFKPEKLNKLINHGLGFKDPDRNQDESTENTENVFLVEDTDVLVEAERTIIAIKIAQLEIKPIQGSFDIKHLNKIHKYLFNDISAAGGSLIENKEIIKIFKDIKKHNFLKQLPIDQLTEGLADYYIRLENEMRKYKGSGFTNREFIRELAAKNGYRLDWNMISDNKLNNIIYSKDKNQLSGLLKNSFKSLEPDKSLIKQFNDMEFIR